MKMYRAKIKAATGVIQDTILTQENLDLIQGGDTGYGINPKTGGTQCFGAGIPWKVEKEEIVI